MSANAEGAAADADFASQSSLPSVVPAPAAKAITSAEKIPDTPQHYLASLIVLAFLFIGAIGVGNRLLAPWMHMPTYKATIAETLINGENYAVFDLNVDIRGIRRAQFAQMTHTPEVIVLGASHWQEASADLMPGHEMFNAHVHRDYYDDIVAAVGLLIKNDRLPQRLVIAIRDKTFTNVAGRTDDLWLPFIPDYVEAQAALGIPPRFWLDNFQPQLYWDLFSLPNQIDMATRWMESEESPGPTRDVKKAGLDILMADGSIRWAEEHAKSFTASRAYRLATEMAQDVRNTMPQLDPHAILAVSRTLEVLAEHGVEVVLVHPPFNPVFYQAIQGSEYRRGLAAVEELTRDLAQTHGATVAGSFNPHDLGCAARMYIDAEHSNPDCLGKVLADVASKFSPNQNAPAKR